MDIKDSYLHGTVGVVKSIAVDGDKIKYTLADVANTTKTVALPLANIENGGIIPKTYSNSRVLMSKNGTPSWEYVPVALKTYSTLNYNGVDVNNGEKHWFTIATNVSDYNTYTFHINTYAHSDIIFNVVKRFTVGYINVLNSSDGNNSAYAYMNAVRLLANGKLQIRLNIPNANDATRVLVKVSVTHTHTGDLGLQNTLVLDNTNYATEDILLTVEMSGTNGSMIAKYFIGNLKGIADSATTLVDKPSLAHSGNTITVTVGGKTSDAFTVPYADSAKFLDGITKPISTQETSSFDEGVDAKYYKFCTIKIPVSSWLRTNALIKILLRNGIGSSGSELAVTTGSDGSGILSIIQLRWVQKLIFDNQIDIVGTKVSDNEYDLYLVSTKAYTGYDIHYMTGYLDKYIFFKSSWSTTPPVVDVVADFRNLSSSIRGGSKGSLLYQSAANETTTLNIGSSGLVLKVNSSGLPQWTTELIVSNSANGLAPKVINTNTATVGSAYYVLASTNGSATPSWYKLPSNAFANDDTKVTQTNTTTSASYRVLLSGNANDTTETTTARKSTNLWFNPSTETLSSTYVYTKGLKGRAESLEDLMKSGLALAYNRFSKPTFTDETGITVSGNANGILWVGTHGPEASNTSDIGYGHMLGFVGENGALYHKIVVNGDTTKAWKQIAYTTSNITGNAASSDKLNTSRKLWGQSFDGSADVSGALSGVTTITATAGLFLLSSNGSIYLRYNGDDNSSICLISNALVPTTNSHNKLNLGRPDNLWKGVYASNFYGNLDWAFITSKPTTLSGYGITNAVEWNANSYYNIKQTSSYSTGDLRMLFSNKDGNCLGIGYAAEEKRVYLHNYIKSKSLDLKDNLYYGNTQIAYITTNFPSKQINALTGYTKATAIGSIAATDSLNTALGKLEYKADSAYELVKGAYDGDGTIENLAEILKVLEGIKDTETIQSIIGKYLPLTGGTLTGKLTIEEGNFGSLIVYRKGSANSASIQFKNGSNVSLGYLGMNTANGNLFRFSADASTSYKIWDSGIDGSGSGLDADLLDGIHASGLFTALSNVNTTDNPYSISATIGGTTKHLKVNYATNSFKMVVEDIRNTTPTPDDASDRSVTAWFNNKDKPGDILWYSGITVAGWVNDYGVWLLASSSQSNDETHLHFRTGRASTWETWRTVLDSSNYTTWINTTNFPGLNKTGTVTSIKVGSTSYSPSSGVVSLPAYPTSLKSPNAIKFKNTAGTEVSYDGSAAVDLTGGVNYARAATHLNNLITLLNANYANVGSIKTKLLEVFGNISYGVGSSVVIPSETVDMWNNDSYEFTHGGKYTAIKLSGGYVGNNYGLWLLSSCGDKRLYYVGLFGGEWTTLRKIAITDDIPTKVSQLTNDSGFLTSRGYIGTTQVQANSASQNLTGIANATLTGDLTLYNASNGNTPAVIFLRGTTTDAPIDWKIFNNNGGNLLILGNTASAGFVNIFRFEHPSYGNQVLSSVKIVPETNNTISLGTSSLKWANVYATTFTGNLTGNVNGNVSGSSESCTGNAATATTLKPITAISAKAFSLSNASWTDTGYTFANLETGTYAVQVTSGTNLVASGIMSVLKNLSDSIGDEIPLHVYGTAGWRPYLRTYQNKLLISANISPDAEDDDKKKSITIKIAQIL